MTTQYLSHQFAAGPYSIWVYTGGGNVWDRSIFSDSDEGSGAPPSNYTRLGNIEGEIEQEQIVSEREITGDNAGDSVQDGIIRGQNVFFSFTAIELNNPLVTAIASFSATSPGHLPIMGMIRSNLVHRFLFIRNYPVHPGLANDLTSLPTTPVGPTTVLGTVTGRPGRFRIPVAKLAPNFPVRLTYNSDLKVLPIRLQCLTYFGLTDTSQPVFYETWDDAVSNPSWI